MEVQTYADTWTNTNPAMQDSEVEDKKTEQTFGRQYSGVMRLCRRQANRVSVRSSPLARDVEGVKNDGKSAHYEPLCVKCSTYMRASTNAAEVTLSGASLEMSKFAALVPSLPMHRTESELVPTSSGLNGSAKTRLRPVPLQRQHSTISND